MKIDGQCHCGQVTFTAEADPNGLRICHCTDCQRLSGTAFRANVSVPASHFVLHGTVTLYVKTAESGNQRRHAFCGTCGTPIYACAANDPQSYSLRIGTITQREAFSPKRQIWRRSAVPWVATLGTVPATEKG
jgi:hypothetical protein